MRRFTPLAGLAIALALFAGANQLAAHAADLPATCATLQTELNAASAGDTVTLTNAGVPCTSPTITYPVTLPSKQITLTGLVAGDGFNGQGTAQLLTGTDVAATVISNLVFENGKFSGGSGAAINISGGASPTVSHCTFLGNTAIGIGAVSLSGTGAITVTASTFGGTGSGAGNTSSGDASGALGVSAEGDLAITQNTFIDNSAAASGAEGGAVVAVSDNPGSLTFSGNTLTGNSETNGGGTGGGATLEAVNNITVSGNVFNSNSIAAGSGKQAGNLGAGLDVRTFGSTSVVTQSHNLFENNHVGSWNDTSSGNTTYFGGAGEYVQAPHITSFDDSFTGNQVDAGANKALAAGGGLGVQGVSGTTSSTLMATNLVATNNSVAGDNSYGGGIYAGFSPGCNAAACPAEIDLFDSTVTGNSAEYGPGMSGGGSADVGRVTNSIVIANTGAVAQLNFGSLTVTRTDSCNGTGAAYTGTGNVCAAPALVNPGGNNVRETSSSPTINAGDNALVPVGVTTDYLGNPRISGGVVDMGAAEFQPSTPVTPPVPASGAMSGAGFPAGPSLMVLGFLLLVGLSLVAVDRRQA